MTDGPAIFRGTSCEMSVDSPAAGVVLLRISGHDVGEFGAAPMEEVERRLTAAPVDLYVDARRTNAASIDVSGDWARWLGSRRSRFRRIRMLAGSPFVRLTADFVRGFSGLESVMEVTTDPRAFDAALAEAVAHGKRTSPR